MKEFRLGEMFCGPGGIGLGAKMASDSRVGSAVIRHSWALDYHHDTVETYRQNINDVPHDQVFTADVREFDLRGTPEFNAFAFGFPCNDFSLVGEQKGLDGKFGPLYTYGVHAIALNEPEWFLAENVTGISSANNGAAFGKILESLKFPSRAALQDPAFTERYMLQDSQPSETTNLDEDLEYELVAHRYKFEEYGVPQARHRILIVGIRKDLENSSNFKVPKPSMVKRTARQALEEPPIPEEASNQEQTRHSETVKERLKLIAPGKNAFNSNFGMNVSVKLNVKGATLSNIYKRLDPDQPAYTVTGSGGGGTQMYHWEELRGLTNRERARLQTFPDNFVFHGGMQSVRRQIGMAVPPEGAKVIIGAILDTLTGTPYDSVAPSVDVAEMIHKYQSLEFTPIQGDLSSQ